jgi:hypothetical protein
MAEYIRFTLPELRDIHIDASMWWILGVAAIFVVWRTMKR